MVQIARTGCEILFLPSYSPDFSPTLLAFSKIKQYLRTVVARIRQVALEKVLALITPEEAVAFSDIVAMLSWLNNFARCYSK